MSRPRLLPHPLRELSYQTLQHLPEVAHAVYVFWSSSLAKAVYVGKAENGVGDRLMQHFKGSNNPGLQMWIRLDQRDLRVTYKCATRRSVGRLEKRMIHELDPVANFVNKP